MDELKIMARTREERGSAASRRLRRAGEVPGNLATVGQEPVALAVDAHELHKVLRSGGHLVSMNLAEEELEVLVREVQLDTFGEKVLHVDFDRVVRGEKLQVEIPLVFYGEPIGAEEGGVFQTHVNSINIECLPRAIPDSIEVVVSALDIGDEIRAKDIVLPEGVELAGLDPEALIVNVSAQSVADEEEAEEEAEEGSEPEVLTEKKEDED